MSRKSDKEPIATGDGDAIDARESQGFINKPTNTQIHQHFHNTPAETLPYTKTDLRNYLQAVIDECDTIRLPYAREGEASLPLERVYVALRADRSSPVERRASNKLFQQLVQEREVQARVEESVIYQVAALNPYAARYLLYDEQWAERLKRNEEERTYHLAEIVRTHRWLVLLGHPGSGKSTLARWLALQLARAMQAGQESVAVRADHVRPDGEPIEKEALGMARLPVIVRIADYAAARWQEGVDNHLPLRRYLGQHISQLLDQPERKAAIYALLNDYLAKKRVTFILDGLDEVTDAQQRNEIVIQIEDLIRDHVCNVQGRNPLDHRLDQSKQKEVLTGNQLIVTSRIVGYQLRPLHENLPHFVIQSMDETAVHRLCDNWVDATQLEVEGEALAYAVLRHGNPYVRNQMGRNPLLLTILAQVFSANPQQGLPARRTLLYRQAKEAVFQQRPNQWGRLAQKMGGDDLERALERITAYLAFQLHANPNYPNSLVDERQAKRWLQAALKREPALKGERRLKDVATDLLQAAANLSGFFVARGEGVYGFLHRQFQEYFAALYLVEQGLEEGNWQPFFERFANPNWQEVLFLTVGSLAEEDEREASAFLTDILDATYLDPTNGLLPHNLLLVAAAMRERETWPKSLVKRVTTALIQAYRRDDEARFKILDERVKEAFKQLPRPHECVDPVGDALIAALSKTGQAKRFTRLAAAELIIESKWYTEGIVRALSRAWQHNAEPASTMLLALKVFYETDQSFFASPSKPLRSKLAPYWQMIARYAHWQTVMQALYSIPWAEFNSDTIIRDSSLTDSLLRLLRNAPEDLVQLVTLLHKTFTDPKSKQVTKRDAGLALAYLGETSIVSALLSSPEEPYQKAIITIITDVRARADVRARNLASVAPIVRADAHALAHALAHADAHVDALTHAYALADELADALAAAEVRENARAFTLAETEVQAQALARADALVRADALARADTLARAVEHPDELVQLITKLQKQATDHPDGETRAELNRVLFHAQAIERRLQPEPGVLDVWTALIEAWQAGEGEEEYWVEGARPKLFLERVEELSRRVQRIEETGVLARLLLLSRLDAAPLKKLSNEAKERVEAQLTAWLAADDPVIARHGALLLAEMGTITPQSLPRLCEYLEDTNDLTRYRAQEAINSQRLASHLGYETIEGMAQLYSSFTRECTTHSLSTDYLYWSLHKIEHDRADWLQAWAEARQTTILGHVYRLSPEVWPVWLELLTTALPAVQEALLDSTLWLLRFSPYAPDDWQYDLNRLTNKQISQLEPVLMALTEATDSSVRLAAIRTVGYLPDPTSEVMRELLTRLPQEKALLETLARLARHSKDNILRNKVRAALINALPDESAGTTLVGLALTEMLNKEREIFKKYSPYFKTRSQTNAILLQQLRQWFHDDEMLLQVLLAAGRGDGFWWLGYNNRIVTLACNVVQQRGGELLHILLYQLEKSPTTDITLATIATCAKVMGDAFNSSRSSEELEELLLKGTRTWNCASRCFAITALSHLRMITPDVMAALLEASRDIRIVQQGAIQAAGNFQHLSQAFDHDEALAPLNEALTSESQATAYLAAQLLAALGRSPAVLGSETLRQRIASMLSSALRHPNAKRDVYVLERDKRGKEQIESKGTLAQTLYEALAQIVALPGGRSHDLGGRILGVYNPIGLRPKKLSLNY